ncbi:unnamed protein product [Vicia faba]|uniref:Uncharacterized protein n=1 Tax=Vicia faba TaxID=3906 RepID=A0AAV1AHI3_VICFA|nr:unnamed protein product [Vicia faba]
MTIVKVRYLIVDALSPYNIIMGRPTLNLLGRPINPEFKHKIYTTYWEGPNSPNGLEDCPRMLSEKPQNEKSEVVAFVIPQPYMQGMNVANLNPWIKHEKERITPIKDLMEVPIGPQVFQVTNLVTSLFEA